MVDSNSSKIRIIIADDHSLMRQAIRIWLEKQLDFEIVAEVSDGESAIKFTKELNPHIIIMDISMPKLNGLEATKQITSQFPGTRVLIISVHIDNERILSALQAGASGYLTKEATGDEIVAAVRGISCGEVVLSPLVSNKVVESLSLIKNTGRNGNIDKISTREYEVLKLVAKGMCNKDIAAELGISLRSVKANLTNIFLKLRVGTRTEAIAAGINYNILSVNDLTKR
jgi:two-component system, NarL family, response regulator LiaR